MRFAKVIPAFLLIVIGAIYPGLAWADASEEAYSQGVRLLASGRFQEAIPFFDEAIRLNHQNARALGARGYAYAMLGQPEGALKDLVEAIRLDPKLAPAYASRGLAYRLLDQNEKAAADYNEAIRLAPRDGRWYAMRGDLYRQRGQPESALKDYDMAVQLLPNDARPYRGRAVTYLGLGQVENAIQDATQALGLGEEDAVASYARGTGYFRLAQWRAAISDLTEVIKLQPLHAGAYLNRAIAYLALDQPASAAADAEAHISRLGWGDRNSVYAALYAHLAYRQVGHGANASRILDEAAARTKPTEWPGPIVQYLRRGLTAEALVALATDKGKETEARAFIGADLVRAGRRDGAQPYLKWVQERGDKKFAEYGIALGDLQRLGPIQDVPPTQATAHPGCAGLRDIQRAECERNAQRGQKPQLPSSAPRGQ